MAKKTVWWGRRPLKVEMPRETADLPDVCVMCGASPALYREELRVEDTSKSSDKGLGFLLFGWAAIFMAALDRNPSARVTLPFCRRHKTLGTRQIQIGLFFLVTAAIAGILVMVPAAGDFVRGIGAEPVAIAYVLVLGGALLSIVLFAYSRPKRSAKVTSHTVTLTGVSQEFAEAVHSRGASAVTETLRQIGEAGRAEPLPWELPPS